MSNTQTSSSTARDTLGASAATGGLPSPERIFARQLARELTVDELASVGGGMPPAFTPLCSTPCNDRDGCCDC